MEGVHNEMEDGKSGQAPPKLDGKLHDDGIGAENTGKNPIEQKGQTGSGEVASPLAA